MNATEDMLEDAQFTMSVSNPSEMFEGMTFKKHE